MRKILLLFCLLSSSICPQVPAGINPLSASSHEIDSVIANVLDEISTDSITAYIQGLQDFGTRYLFAENRDSVSEWIKTKFEGFGYSSVRLDSFQYEGTWQRNVEATLASETGSASEIVIGAHHDCHTFNTPYTNTPGADDNGSGTAAVLEIARVLKKLGYKSNLSFKFVTFAAEELGLHGSIHYATEAFEASKKIRLMINHDMISYCKKSLQTSGVLIRASNMAKHISRISQGLASKFTVLDTALLRSGSDGSDSYSFSSIGYPAIWFEEEVFSPYYHLITDLVSNHNMPYCAEVIKLSCATLIYSDNTPDPVASLRIYDEGTGSSLLVTWESEAKHHHVYVGRQPGIYDTIYSVMGTSFSIPGLKQNEIYYIGVSGYSPLGPEGIIKEISSLPTKIPAAPAAITDIPEKSNILLTWERNRELDVIGYNVYRASDSLVRFIKLNTEVITDTQYCDPNVKDSIYYYYEVKAVDNTGIESSGAAIRSRAVGLHNGILVVDETPDGDDSPLSPADSSVDRFFADILERYNVSNYDIFKNKLIKLADIGAYSTVIWNRNGITDSSALSRMQNDIKRYLDFGGNFIFNGYFPVECFIGSKSKITKFEQGSFLYDYLKIAGYEKERSPRFFGAKSLSDDYKSVFVDTTKTLAEHGFHLLNVEVLTSAPGGENIYSFESKYGTFTTEGYFNGKCVGIENSGSSGRTLILSFPLFYTAKENAKEFIESVLEKFNEKSRPEEPVHLTSYKLWQNYPNPFNSSTTIIYEVPEPSQITLSVYDILGKEAGTLVNEFKNPGRYTIKYSAGALCSGIYYYRLAAGGNIISQKMIVLK